MDYFTYLFEVDWIIEATDLDGYLTTGCEYLVLRYEATQL